MDAWFFLQLNGLAGHSPWLAPAVRLLVNDYLVPTALALILFGLWFAGAAPEDRARNQRAVVVAVLAVVVANSLVKVCNWVYFRPRPFAEHPVTLLFYRPTDSSWPSNPAAAAFALAGAAWLHNRRAGAWGLLLAGSMALARVMAGVHYPLDVIGGGLIGYGSAYWVARAAPGVNRLVERVRRLARALYLA